MSIDTDIQTENVTGLDYEEQLIDHLHVPESAMILYRQRFDEKFLVEDKDHEISKLMQFVMSYINQHQQPPTPEMLVNDFAFQIEPPKSDIGWLIDRMRQRWKRNEAKKALLTATHKIGSDPDLAVSLGLNRLAEIQTATADRDIELDTDDWGSAYEAYRQKVLAGRFMGKTLGFPEVDEVLGGLRFGLTFYLARPKRFKSWMLLKSLVEGMFHADNPTRGVMHTLELSKDEMYHRFMCMVAGVSYSNFYNGRMTKEEQETFRACEADMADLDEERKSFFLHPEPEHRTVPSLVQYARERGANALYIDQLSFIRAMKEYQERHKEVEYICAELKEASHEFPIVCAAQFNREAASLTEMADTSKIGLSDAVGQKADLLLGIHQTKEMQAQRIAEFGVVDARNVPLARWHIRNDISERSDITLIRRVEVT